MISPNSSPRGARPRRHARNPAGAWRLDQHLVAHRMAEHVVHFLQPVEVDAQHREFLVGALAGLDHLGQRLQEGGTVRQIGQAVMIGHVRHARLGLAAIRDVLVGLDQVLRLAGIVEHRHAAGQEQPQAVLGRDRVFLGEQAALLDRGLVARDDQFGFTRIEDIDGGQPGGILAAAIEDGFGAAVGEQIFPSLTRSTISDTGILSTTSSRNFLVLSSSRDSDRRSVTSSNSAIRNSGSYSHWRATTRLEARTRFSLPRSTTNSLR